MSSSKHTNLHGSPGLTASAVAATKRDSIKCSSSSNHQFGRTNSGAGGQGKRDSLSDAQPTHSPELQRRESLVKPTWQNISPGQVPAVTLQRLRKMSSGDDAAHGQAFAANPSKPAQQQQQQQPLLANGGRTGAYAANNRLISATTIMKRVQRDEPFDVFGKVVYRLNPLSLFADMMEG